MRIKRHIKTLLLNLSSLLSDLSIWGHFIYSKLLNTNSWSDLIDFLFSVIVEPPLPSPDVVIAVSLSEWGPVTSQVTSVRVLDPLGEERSQFTRRHRASQSQLKLTQTWQFWSFTQTSDPALLSDIWQSTACHQRHMIYDYKGQDKLTFCFKKIFQI